MKFSYKFLESFFDKKIIPPKKLAELLTMHSFEVSEVEKIGKDWLLDIEVLPNRAGDCFSHLGIAREISVLTGIPLKKEYLKKVRFTKEFGGIEGFFGLKIKHKWACPRYSAGVIKGLKVKESPQWLKERLITCGQKPINNIVDATNYVMLETGQPLHAFDLEKIEDKKIIVRFAKEGERIITLDNREFALNSEVLVIADEKGPMAIAGIKGGKGPEIGKKTKDIVLEAAHFNPQLIRRASRQLNLRTDASVRFEHGVAPEFTEYALERAMDLIVKLAGGKMVKKIADFYPQKRIGKRVKLNLASLNSLIGIRIPEKTVKEILKRLGFSFRSAEKNKKILQIEVPFWRMDISIPQDITEEVARVYGYNRLPRVFPLSVLVPPERNFDIFWENKAKDILKEAGFFEVYNYSFVSEKEKKILKEADLFELENPISKEFKYLRKSLIAGLLKNVQQNQKNFSQIKIFELGKVFLKEKGKVKEKRMLSGAIMGNAFYELKGVIDVLFNKMGVADPWYDEYQPTPEQSPLEIWQREKSAEIKVDNKEVGFLGQISPKMLKELKIEKEVALFQIDFDEFSKMVSEEKVYQPISRYPSAVRDIAVLTPRFTKVEEVLNKIETAGGALLVDVDLFDIYEGENLPEGKKNLAFHLIFQAPDRTLSPKELNLLQDKIIKTLEENPEWEVRR